MDLKALGLLLWDSGLKACLEKVAEDSSNKWDDMAIGMVDNVVRKVLG